MHGLVRPPGRRHCEDGDRDRHLRAVDRHGKPAPRRHANSLADEGAKLRASPAGRVEQHAGELVFDGTRKPPNEGGSLTTERTERGHRKHDQPHPRW